LPGILNTANIWDMKISAMIVTLCLYFYSTTSFSHQRFYEVPSTPPEPCYGGSCNEFMEKVVSDFTLLGQTPSLMPAVYSGTCRHLGMYSPDRDHYAVVLLDQFPVDATPLLETARFSAIMAYFFDKNEYVDWNLQTARLEMSPYWLDQGSMKYADNTYRVVINDENQNPVLVYWMRQNPITHELYFIFYSGSVMRSFCQLQKNANQ
jgi:hypothetical protein